MKIIVRRDPFNGRYDRTYSWVAMRQHDYENYEPEYPAGHGATPLEAIADLLWLFDLEDDTPYCMEIRD